MLACPPEFCQLSVQLAIISCEILPIFVEISLEIGMFVTEWAKGYQGLDNKA